MNWFLAFAGFALLIILHELGHFAAAKAVGMRVERYSLFFPPLIWRKKVGETEYAIGSVPLGGYVKITGMNPHEEIPPEVLPRAYFKQAVWKRIVVILAGPAVNIVIAFLILSGLYLAQGVDEPTKRVGSVDRAYPAHGILMPGDEILAVDGRPGSQEEMSLRIAGHRCAGKPASGCRSRQPVKLLVRRDGREIRLTLRPVFDPEQERMRVGFGFAFRHRDVGAVEAARLSVVGMWEVTAATVSTIAQIFDPKKREEISGVVGSYEVTRQAIDLDTVLALQILALISLSLGVINLFPFLPLDGGHIFWALAEKVRGRPIPFSVMERSGIVGFMLVIFLFMIGLTNDIQRLTGEGFNLR